MCTSGDLLVSHSLSRVLSSTYGFNEINRTVSSGSYVVVPAFEVVVSKKLPGKLTTAEAVAQGMRLAQEAASYTKAELLQAVNESRVWPFRYFQGYRKGHGATNYSL